MSDILNARRLVLLLLVPAVALSVAGCRALVREAFKTPKVRFVDVSVSTATLIDPKGSWDALIHLSVENPNPYALDVAYVAYTACVGTETVAQGEHREPIRIAPSGATVVRVPIHLLPEGFHAAARKVLAARSVPYEFNGSIGVNAPMAGVVRVPFSKIGKLDPLDILRRKGIQFN